MLKIKDNVDLKELEKFGFEKTDELIAGIKEEVWLKKLNLSEIIEVHNRIIVFFIDDEYYLQYLYDNSLDIIYDLIQAGLVEKVGDNQ